MNHNLKITNSLTRKKELFKPINPEQITMYACGPTVYDNPHVGNARTLVVFDILFRVLKLVYKNVNYVRNITDIDDKIIETSKKINKPINEITKEVTKIFHENCKALNCLVPTTEPKATDHIQEMIEMIKSLIEKKFAYESEGHVYFSVTSFKNYGKVIK
jgi:cysteinyl-tRNA synthetase